MNLERAKLGEANLTEAFLFGANLRAADLAGATGLSWKQLGHARRDQYTKLPAYLLEENKKPEEGDTP